MHRRSSLSIGRAASHRARLLAGVAIGLLPCGIAIAAHAAGGGTAYDGSTSLNATGGGQAGNATGGAGGNYGQPGGGPGGGAAGANGTSAATLNNAAPLAGTDGAVGSGDLSGGGSGGAGAIVTGATGNANSSTITGGNGGGGSVGSPVFLANPTVGTVDAIGGGGGAGGSGLVFTRGGVSLSNTGTITGGNGGGFDFIDLGGSSAPLIVSSTVNGTTMATAGGGGAGGTGVVFSGPNSRLDGAGSVVGGNGGGGGTSGAVLVSSAFNAPIFTIGGDGGAGGAGVVFARAGALVNVSSPIGGGFGGNGGNATSAAVSNVIGAFNSRLGNGGAGGTGLVLSGGSSLSNTSAIGGGAGGLGGVSVNAFVSNLITSYVTRSGDGGSGGSGIFASGGGNTIVNTMSVAGGDGGDGGIIGDAVVSNAIGSVDQRSGNGGNGGSGLTVAGANARITNSGMISGGAGGDGGSNLSPFIGNSIGSLVSQGGNGGAGGVGASFSGVGARLTNSGTIFGGDGGLAGLAGTPGAPGAGGIGVVAAGIRIDNTGGTIAGGFADAGVGAQNFAIEFTGYRNFVGGAGQIVGGIDVRGRAHFQPALPGSPLGTPLTIIGPLRFSRTATYSIRIDGPANDSTLVTSGMGLTGTATPNHGKVFVVTPGTVPVRGMRYTIVTADGGVDGRFRPTVGSNLAFFAPTLAYDATHVYLESKYNYALPALTLNERRVGLALNNAARQPLNGVSTRIFNALETVPKANGPAVLDSLSGEGITATQNLAYRMGALFTSSIFDQTTFYGPGAAGNSITLSAPMPGFSATAPQAPIRELADLPSRHEEPIFVAPQRTWRAWATGYGGAENIDGNAFPIGSANQHNSLYGGVLGVDYQMTPNYLFGVALGGSSGDFQVPGRGTTGSTSGGQIAIYDLATFGAFYGASSSSFAYYGNRTTRTVAGFGNLGGETERGTFDSHEFRSRLEFGRHIDGYGMSITPFVALEIAQFRSNGFGETSQQGAGLFRLNVSGMSQASVPSFVGLRFQRLAPIGGMTFMPTLQVAWVHEFAPYRQQYAAIIDLPGASFLIDGARPAYNAAQVKVGGELQLRPGTAVFANFDGEFSGVNQFYAGKGGVRWTW